MLCFLEKKIVDAHNVDVLIRRRWYDPKMSTVVDIRPDQMPYGGGGDNMMGNNIVVGEWQGNFRHSTYP